MRRNYFFSRNRDALLEPCDGKLSRTVLRGESPRKGADLLDAEYILTDLSQDYEGQEFLTRIDMLSELLYQDALLKEPDEKKYLLAKALYLKEYLDSHSDTFSFERRNKINEIKKLLEL